MVWWCGDVVMWWCGGVVVWWCGGVVVWWCGNKKCCRGVILGAPCAMDSRSLGRVTPLFTMPSLYCVFVFLLIGSTCYSLSFRAVFGLPYGTALDVLPSPRPTPENDLVAVQGRMAQTL